MSVNTRSEYVPVSVDRWGLLLAVLFLLVLGGSVWFASALADLGTTSVMSESSGGEQAAAGAGWAVLEVLVAVGMLALILVWRRLPEYVQEIVRTGLKMLAGMWVGVLAYRLDLFWPIAAGAILYFAIIEVSEAFDVYWLWNNVEAIALAIVLGGVLGAVLPIPFLIVGLLGLTVYDHVFANQNDWMFTLGGGLLRAKLPVVVFAFPRLRVAWDRICEAMEQPNDETGEGEGLFASRSGFGIGMADLMFPGAFAAAVAVSSAGTVSLPLVGVIVGVVVAAFRLRWEMLNVGGGAGLPSITAGVLGGYMVAVIPVVMFA